jgi:hypothetical protein
MKDYGSVIDDSNRTSVHVHLNCQGFTLTGLPLLLRCYFAVEEVLTQWCGEHRVGNLFCLRAQDATGIVSAFRKFVKSDGKFEFNDGYHYAGLNAQALKKHGSLEIRSMRGVKDPKVIIDWVRVLQRMYELSAEYKDPREVCSMFSGYGPLMFFEKILGSTASIIRGGVNWSDDDLSKSMLRGIRLAQDIVYCRDWDLYATQEVKPDPFSRKQSVVAKKLVGLSNKTIPLVWDSSGVQVTYDEHYEHSPQPATPTPSHLSWGEYINGQLNNSGLASLNNAFIHVSN